MPLTQADVVRAAIALLDEVGLAGLTLRRLAADLGVSAPTLYWHVQHKRELLDLIAEEIVAEVGDRKASPLPGESWWDWLAEQSRLQWRALVAHRDAALVVAGNRPTASSLLRLEETIASLVAAGFQPAEALEHLFALGHYVMGCALEYQAERARQEQVTADAAAAVRMREQVIALPYLSAAFAQRPPAQPAASFDHGLQLLIGGMRMLLAERSRAEPSRTAAASSSTGAWVGQPGR
jgi:TetR/AcrR family transcriptional regulator, tetracycline repressor protein